MYLTKEEKKERREAFFIGVAIAAGCIAGYALFKTNQTNKLLTNGLNNIKDNIQVDIPQNLINKAMEEAVAEEAKREAKNAANRIAAHVEKDISNQVAELIKPIKKEVSDMVIDSFIEEVEAGESDMIRYLRSDLVDYVCDSIDMDALAEEVTSAAKKKVVKKIVKEIAS